MIVETFEQYGKQWWENRTGHITASVVSDIVTSTGKKSGSFRTRAFKVAADLMMGHCAETFQSEAMRRGTELEPQARECFEFITGLDVQQVGMVTKDEKRLISCSPDGLGDGFGVELKCPLAHTHVKYLYDNKIPTTYKPQCFASLYICDEVDRWAFMSYHPELEPFLKWFDRTDKEYLVYVEALEKYLPEFVALVNKIAEG